MRCSRATVRTRRAPGCEIGNPWVATAVANGVFELTGKRLYHMPFTPERVKTVLKT